MCTFHDCHQQRLANDLESTAIYRSTIVRRVAADSQESNSLFFLSQEFRINNKFLFSVHAHIETNFM